MRHDLGRGDHVGAAVGGVCYHQQSRNRGAPIIVAAQQRGIAVVDLHVGTEAQHVAYCMYVFRKVQSRKEHLRQRYGKGPWTMGMAMAVHHARNHEMLNEAKTYMI